MASAAEQLASSLNLGAFAKATELKKRIWFTLGALVIYRLGTYIPLPGIDPQILAEIFKSQSGGLLDIFDMFSGGALGRMTIFALTIMPYISASIIIQLLTAVSPTLEALKKEGEVGRKKLNQYTRYRTAFLAAVQAYGIATGPDVRGRGRGDHLHRVHGARAAAHPGPVPKAPGRQQDVRRRGLASAAQAQQLRRDPADLRLLAAAAALDDRQPCLAGQLPRGHRPVPASGLAGAHGALRGAHHLLLLLLYRDRVQPRGDRGEPAQVRRFRAGHPAGQ